MKGRCNDLKSTYAIYIIDVTKEFDDKSHYEYWQTYRRFNDFHDLHLILKNCSQSSKSPSKLFEISFRNDEGVVEATS